MVEEKKNRRSEKGEEGYLDLKKIADKKSDRSKKAGLKNKKEKVSGVIKEKE